MMTEAQADVGASPDEHSRSGASSWWSGSSSSLTCDGSLPSKAVRFGSLEPAGVTLAKQCVLPGVVAIVSTACMWGSGATHSAGCYALGLLAFLVSAQVFKPLELRHGAARRTPSSFPRQIPRRMLEWSIVAAALMFTCASFKLHVFSPDATLTWIVLTPAALLAAEALSSPVIKFMMSDRAALPRYVIVGHNEVGLEFARRIENFDSYGEFYGFLDFRSEQRLGVPRDPRITANCKPADFADFVRSKSIDRVYLALPLAASPRIEELLKELRDTTASIYFVPNIFAFDLVQPRCLEIGGMPAISICDSPLQGLSALWKRVFDIMLASLLLLILWPVFLVIAAAIIRTSPGPVLFKQRRHGLRGDEFLVYKFRTMSVCEDGPVIAQATRHDPRVTPLGAYLRRMSFDELPQIFNVLEGTMSFVGPRPHAVAHNEEYRKLINGYMMRHKVRPGISGWAQVNGLRGETSTLEAMRRRVQYDLDYLRNWSLWLDIKIIARTIYTVIQGGNAY